MSKLKIDKRIHQRRNKNKNFLVCYTKHIFLISEEYNTYFKGIMAFLGILLHNVKNSQLFMFNNYYFLQKFLKTVYFTFTKKKHKKKNFFLSKFRYRKQLIQTFPIYAEYTQQVRLLCNRYTYSMYIYYRNFINAGEKHWLLLLG